MGEFIEPLAKRGNPSTNMYNNDQLNRTCSARQVDSGFKAKSDIVYGSYSVHSPKIPTRNVIRSFCHYTSCLPPYDLSKVLFEKFGCLLVSSHTHTYMLAWPGFWILSRRLKRRGHDVPLTRESIPRDFLLFPGPREHPSTRATWYGTSRPRHLRHLS